MLHPGSGPVHALQMISSDGNKDSGASSSDSQAHSSGEEEQHDIPQTSIDWNAAWTQFQESGIKPMTKGREPLPRETVAAKKVVNRVRASVTQVTSRLPSRQMLFNDWRFWVGIILALSVFSALVGSSHPQLAPGVGQV